MNTGVLNTSDGNKIVSESVSKFVSNSSRDIALATGNQIVTGIGFQPRSVEFVATVPSAAGRFSIGYTDGTSDRVIYDKHNEVANSFTHGNAVMVMNINGATQSTCTLVSLDSDGFTLNWVKFGAATGTCEYKFIAIK